MISFVLQPFNKEHVVVFTMSWVAALSKLTYLKYNLPERFEISVLVKSSTLHFFFFFYYNQEFSLHLYPLPGLIHPHNSKLGSVSSASLTPFCNYTLVSKFTRLTLSWEETVTFKIMTCLVQTASQHQRL